jgi:hypothetical protein
MTIDSRLEKITLSFALSLPCVASLALMFMAPGSVSATTYAVVVALLLGTVIVGVHTWQSAQATSSVGQLIYETNTNKGTVYAPSAKRLVTILSVSAVMTALIVATWLS